MAEILVQQGKEAVFGQPMVTWRSRQPFSVQPLLLFGSSRFGSTPNPALLRRVSRSLEGYGEKVVRQRSAAVGGQTPIVSARIQNGYDIS
jgi:hypothetical protein